MIGWLSGEVVVRDATRGEVVVDVGGVGYQVTVSWQTMAAIPEVGQPCVLWVHTHVRAEALALFGFATQAERTMFRLLTSVPQVGPKNAIGVLGGFPLPELLTAIADGERRTLERIPGVGKRTAERILLDLKEKVEPLRMVSTASGAQAKASEPERDEDPVVTEARAVLVNLGWKAKPVDAALDKAAAGIEGTLELEPLVRGALVLLMGGGR